MNKKGFLNWLKGWFQEKNSIRIFVNALYVGIWIAALIYANHLIRPALGESTSDFVIAAAGIFAIALGGYLNLSPAK